MSRRHIRDHLGQWFRLGSAILTAPAEYLGDLADTLSPRLPDEITDEHGRQACNYCYQPIVHPRCGKCGQHLPIVGPRRDDEHPTRGEEP